MKGRNCPMSFVSDEMVGKTAEVVEERSSVNYEEQGKGMNEETILLNAKECTG
jgi:hypothetical protein